MNITVSIDEVTLDTIVGQVVSYDEDGDMIQNGDKTVAHLVVEQIVAQAVKRPEYTELQTRIAEVRKEQIRDALAPIVAEAIAKPVMQTNSWGERTGKETTLTALIMDEARKYLAEPADAYGSNRQTLLQKAIREQVQAAFAQEIADAVKAAKAAVVKEIGDQYGQYITAAVSKAIKTV